MKITHSNLIRLHLRVTHGITVKSCERKKERLLIGGAKLFGVALENLPRRYIPEFGLVPCFLVDACLFLLERAGTVGLFRKPGSLPRMKTLRAKLNRGEGSLSTALPYDVASLIKQFCRELPEPLFPSELHGALLKAQALPALQDRTSAIQLLSCLLPAKNFSLLHYLFNFLFKVSQRCTENLMTSTNLAVVFVPCLLPPPNRAEMSEERLELRVLALRNFIESPHTFGVIPKAVMDSMTFLMDSKRGSRKRQYLQVVSSMKTPVRSKLRPPSVSEQSQGATPINRRPLRRSLGVEAFPDVLLFRTSTDRGLSPATAFLHSTSPAGKEACRTPCERFKRESRGIVRFPKFTRGQDTGNSPVLTGVGKLHLTPWRRRSTL